MAQDDLNNKKLGKDSSKSNVKSAKSAAAKPSGAKSPSGKTQAAKKTGTTKVSQSTKKVSSGTKKTATATKPVSKNNEKAASFNLAQQTAQLVDIKKLDEEKALDKNTAIDKKKFKLKLSFKKSKIKPAPLSSVKRFSPDLKSGLNDTQIKQRESEHLINATDTKYSKSYKSIFFGNIFTFFNLLCFVTFGALLYAGAGFGDMFFVVVFSLNIIIGIIQEIKAKLSIEKLSILSSPTAKVIRNGCECEIDLKQIVLDDIIILTTGQQVPTDCILASGVPEVNESLLTGESIPVKKEIGDNLYAGSFISSGNCVVRAEKVGKFNYIETLTSKAKKYKKPDSELLNSLKLIMTVIGILIVPITALMFGINYRETGLDLNLTIKKTAAVAIGMIPAGMFLLTSMALAVGVIRLAKNNTLVQDLYSLEMLARVDVLCLDKTGTITDGRMKVSDCLLVNNNEKFTINEIVGSMLAALNDNNQTSIALYNHFGHSNMLKPTRILPFSSSRKLSAVSFESEGTFVLGAPEFVLKTLPVKINRLVTQYTAMGLRVLLVAHTPLQIASDSVPASLKPVALITIADNIREDAIQTIRWFKENDVDIKVISGDNPVTVSEVARRVGIAGAERYISLEGLNDKEVISVAMKYSVFGRVSPEQKAVLVKALKAAGKTVAMTGDGVNDILALKEANCAISVASGSEAARNVSHLVLMDNNFASMPKVVFEGRRVINNIQKSSSLYLMKTLFTTVFALMSIFSGEIYPFTPANLLMLETFIIGIPSFALSLQPNSAKVKGKFISYVLTRAIPAAIILIFNVWIFKNLKIFLPSFDTVNYTTMATISLTFAGLVMLYRISSPLNAYRAFLFALMVFCCCIVIIYFGQTNTLQLNKLSWEYNLMIICLVQLDFPLSKGLLYVFDKMRSGDKKLN